MSVGRRILGAKIKAKDRVLEDTQGRRVLCKRGLLDQDSRMS